MDTANRYDDIDALWNATPVPPLSRVEALRAARQLCRKFGRKTDYPAQHRDVRWYREARKCWVTSEKTCDRSDRGWPRLVHDISHRIFSARYPQFRPHHTLHAVLEREIAHFVINESNWLTGALRPKPPAPVDRKVQNLERTDAALKRWDSKLRRAQTAIRKLKQRRARLVRAAAA